MAKKKERKLPPGVEAVYEDHALVDVGETFVNQGVLQAAAFFVPAGSKAAMFSIQCAVVAIACLYNAEPDNIRRRPPPARPELEKPTGPR